MKTSIDNLLHNFSRSIPKEQIEQTKLVSEQVRNLYFNEENRVVNLVMIVHDSEGHLF